MDNYNEIVYILSLCKASLGNGVMDYNAVIYKTGMLLVLLLIKLIVIPLQFHINNNNNNIDQMKLYSTQILF